MLLDWAWEARGTGWAFTVTPAAGQLFDARLRRARTELEKAIQLNPSGWEAHGSLLTAYEAMGRPTYPTPDQLGLLRKAAELSTGEAQAFERGQITLTVPPHGLALLECPVLHGEREVLQAAAGFFPCGVQVLLRLQGLPLCGDQAVLGVAYLFLGAHRGVRGGGSRVGQVGFGGLHPFLR